MAWFLRSGLSYSDCSKVNIVSEPLCVKCHYIYLASLSRVEDIIMIELLYND